MARHRHSVVENPGQLAAVVTVAVAVGFAIGALATSRSGKDNREAIKNRIRAFTNRSVTAKDEVSSRASEAKDFVVDAVKEVDSDEKPIKDAPEKDLPEK